MKAIIFHQIGGSEQLQWEEQELRDPQAGEVRLRITSVGLNRADCLFTEGKYFVKPHFPSRVGFEGAGIVDAVGANVACRVGDRMGVLPCSFDASVEGCCAEYAIFPESLLVPTPSSIPDEEAGGIWMQYITAWGALVEQGGLKEGDCVVIPAASSSVGVAAIQVVNAFGGLSIATTTNIEKASVLKELGAAHVLHAQDEDYVAQVKSLSGGQGANLVFDPVAGPTIRQHIAATAPNAKIFIYGLLDRQPMDIHAGVLMKKNLTIKGYTLYDLYHDRELMQRMIQQITERLEQKQLQPIFAKRFKLSEAAQAFEYMRSNQQVGKILLNP